MQLSFCYLELNGTWGERPFRGRVNASLKFVCILYRRGKRTVKKRTDLGKKLGSYHHYYTRLGLDSNPINLSTSDVIGNYHHHLDQVITIKVVIAALAFVHSITLITLATTGQSTYCRLAKLTIQDLPFSHQ